MDAEAIYRSDLRNNMPQEDIAVLVAQARQGDHEAKQRIILSLLPVLCAYASKMQRVSVDFMELASYGNSVLVEKIDEALAHPNPPGYLLKFAWHEMLHHRERDEQAITTPTTPGDDPYVVRRLSELSDEGGEYHLATGQPEAFKACQEGYTPLYEALDTLPVAGQIFLCRFYGLRGYGTESLTHICGGDSATKQYQAAKMRKLYYLKNMRRYLECRHPVFVQRHCRAARKAEKSTNITIPACTLSKLQEAENTLRAQGTKLSMNKLRIASGVHTRYASAYFQRSREALV